MTTYSDVVEACNKENVSVTDVDRILLNPSTYKDWCEKMEQTGNIETSDYATISGPAVRETEGQEHIVYMDKNGYEHRIVL